MAEDKSPEKKYPAANEDIDTIITGLDGQDYVVDVGDDGVKKWVLYLPEANHCVIIEKILPPLASLCIEEKDTKKPVPTKYHLFLSEMTKKIKESEPDLPAKDRQKKIQQLWKERKGDVA
jgi:hypothetical protein